MGNRYKYITKDQYQWRAGKIEKWPNLWTWAGKYPHEENSYPTESPNGRTRVLVGKEAVRCYNVELWDEDEWYIERKDNGFEGAWIPFSVCRKCQHYMKGASSGPQRYPRCALYREKRKNFRTPLELIAEAWKEAMK